MNVLDLLAERIWKEGYVGEIIEDKLKGSPDSKDEVPKIRSLRVDWNLFRKITWFPEAKVNLTVGVPQHLTVASSNEKENVKLGWLNENLANLIAIDKALPERAVLERIYKDGEGGLSLLNWGLSSTAEVTYLLKSGTITVAERKEGLQVNLCTNAQTLARIKPFITCASADALWFSEYTKWFETLRQQPDFIKWDTSFAWSVTQFIHTAQPYQEFVATSHHGECRVRMEEHGIKTSYNLKNSKKDPDKAEIEKLAEFSKWLNTGGSKLFEKLPKRWEIERIIEEKRDKELSRTNVIEMSAELDLS